jgi:hypothetical protein
LSESANSWYIPFPQTHHITHINISQALTRHEIRLRGPFDPLPYSALVDACERFFEYLVSVRQSSLFFHPYYITHNEEAADALLSFRRDAVATILMNLYVLAGALRGHRKVPVNIPSSFFLILFIYPPSLIKIKSLTTPQRYLPSAALARKRLLDKMAEIEASLAHTRELERMQSGDDTGERRRWSQIYSYSYSQSLTGCVRQLEQLIVFTKEIVGEQG